VPVKDFDIKEYVNGLFKDASIPEDQRKLVEQVLLAEGVSRRLRDDVLRQEDYTRRTQELAEQRRAGEAATKAELEKYQAGYAATAKWKADQQNVIADWKTELQASRDREAMLTAAIARAKAQGLEDKDLGLDPETLRRQPARREEEPPNPKYVTTEQLAEERRTLGTAFTDFTPALIDIYDRHKALFPDQNLNMAALVAAARTQNKPVEDIWSDQYKVPERIQTLQQAALDAKLTTAREEGLKAGRDNALREMATGQVVPGTPGGRPMVLGPAFHVEDVKAQMGPGNGATSPDPVMNAVEAYRSQKYTGTKGAA
jgi:hypothetical protein